MDAGAAVRGKKFAGANRCMCKCTIGETNLIAMGALCMHHCNDGSDSPGCFVDAPLANSLEINSLQHNRGKWYSEGRPGGEKSD